MKGRSISNPQQGEAAIEDQKARTPKAHRSIGVMVGASLISACCGVILTFCVPRLLSVDDFGYWRTFLLYAGYAGLLHLGLIDGALLLWSRSTDQQSGSPSQKTLRRALSFVGVEHVLAVLVAAASFLLPIPHAASVLLAAVAVYAMLFNLVGLLQVYMQTGFRFTAVAFGMTAPGVIFVACLGVLALTNVSVYRLLCAYLASWAVVLAVLFVIAFWSAPRSGVVNPDEPRAGWRLVMACISAGWPIVLSNTTYGLMQSADRVTVNLTRPLHDFAIYSLSQSTIYVPITILAAVSRVAFSWFARTHPSEGASVYRSSTRWLTLIWMVLLPYYYVVEFVVRRFLPRYVLGLGAGRILLLSVLFLSLIQIVQLNTFSLAGRQRQFFLGAILFAAVAFVTAWIGSQRIGTLVAVAWSQVLTAGLWWLFNEWLLRDKNFLRLRDILCVLATFSLSTGGLYVGSLGVGSLGNLSTAWGGAIYYGCVAVPAFLLYRDEVGACWNGLAQLRGRFLHRA